MGDKEIEEMCRGTFVSPKELKEFLNNPLGYCETLVAEVEKDSPRMFAKFLERQNEQLSKIFRNEHKD